ncbi:YqzE family protein [Metabacillus sp. GX 13764]|uniref:YqzE family protein n=1 Tax=Metabacillus kandeliae TaxID=2900151 RepID=UPI001E580BED|nr:YqzE family protein [Metabacillus kandeliae]MCD7033132.1 YqzE family protein [Metabacillus kandeliae]
MSTNDYVKYLTQQFVKYMDTPKEKRMEQKKLRKDERLPAVNRWFGILPFGVMLLFKNRRKQ